MKTTVSNWREQRIQLPGRMTFLPYYTSSPWGKEEAYFIFFSVRPDFTGLRLHAWSPSEQKITADLSLDRWNGVPPKVVSEELLPSFFLPDQEVLLLPRGPELYRVPLHGGEPELVYRHSDSATRIGGPGNRSADGKLAAFGVYSLEPGKPERSGLLIFDTASLECLAALPFGGFFANHFQFQKDTDWLMFAHEGATETIPDRVNRINWKTGEKQVLHHHEISADGKLLECIGHEMTGGDTICAVRYPVSVLPGALVVMGLDGSNYTALDCDDYWHSSCNADGTVFAMDTMWWGNTKRKTEKEFDIIRIDRAAGTKEIVKTIHSDPTGQYRHPHPQLNAAGNRMLFIENSDTDDTLGSITFREMC